MNDFKEMVVISTKEYNNLVRQANNYSEIRSSSYYLFDTETQICYSTKKGKVKLNCVKVLIEERDIHIKNSRDLWTIKYDIEKYLDMKWYKRIFNTKKLRDALHRE